jgi:putative sigma-54 modulation protein
MSIEVTARHMDARDVVLEYARGKADALVAEFPGIEHIHVILDAEKHQRVAEVVVQARNHVRVEAAESSENLRTAIDMAVDKVEKQMRRVREKRYDHKLAMRQGEAERARVNGSEG